MKNLVDIVIYLLMPPWIRRPGSLQIQIFPKNNCFIQSKNKSRSVIIIHTYIDFKQFFPFFTIEIQDVVIDIQILSIFNIWNINHSKLFGTAKTAVLKHHSIIIHAEYETKKKYSILRFLFLSANRICIQIFHVVFFFLFSLILWMLLIRKIYQTLYSSMHWFCFAFEKPQNREVRQRALFNFQCIWLRFNFFFSFHSRLNWNKQFILLRWIYIVAWCMVVRNPFPLLPISFHYPVDCESLLFHYFFSLFFSVSYSISYSHLHMTSNVALNNGNKSIEMIWSLKKNRSILERHTAYIHRYIHIATLEPISSV